MRKQQSGFTLIELVAVIVILGALAVVALPRFINLQGEADRAALQGVAGGLGSDAAVNLAGALAGNDSAVQATNCNDFDVQGGLQSPYEIESNAFGSATTGAAFTCEVENTEAGITASFQGFNVPNDPTP